jgi:hypothetical protein
MAGRARRAAGRLANRARRAATGKGKSRITKTRKQVYGKLRDSEGMGETKAAKIANKGKTFKGRSEMAKKGWETRRKRSNG